MKIIDKCSIFTYKQKKPRFIPGFSFMRNLFLLVFVTGLTEKFKHIRFINLDTRLIERIDT